MSMERDLLDTWVRALLEKFAPGLENEPFRLREARALSACFVLLCAQSVLGIADDELLSGLTEGGDDNDVDYFHVGDAVDGEFNVYLFQGKYKSPENEESNFPESAFPGLFNTLKLLTRPHTLLPGNPRFLVRAEEVRSRIKEGLIPRFYIYLCNNGKTWTETAQKKIDAERFRPDQVTFTHVNHSSLALMRLTKKPIDLGFKTIGNSTIDNFHFKRVLIARVSAMEIFRLVEKHGDKLFERNIRRYLGLSQSEVNQDIQATLSNSDARSEFYFLNNGITCLCSKFSDQGIERDNFVKVQGFQIVNGAQTCNTIHRVLKPLIAGGESEGDFRETFVLLRLYEVGQDDPIADKITFATNHQNPIEIYDLKASDPIQERLEIGIDGLDAGVVYRRKRDDKSPGQSTITPLTLAESVYAVWHGKPHTAKFRRLDLLRKFYAEIFSDDLTPAQAVIAVQIFRSVESRRKSFPSPEIAGLPQWLPYASYFLAALIGDELLKSLGIALRNLTNTQYRKAEETLNQKFQDFYSSSLRRLESALADVAGNTTSLQQLSAAFRRPELCEQLGLRAKGSSPS